MAFFNKNTFSKIIIISVSFIIIAMILWNTYTFFQIFKAEERLKMELWAKAEKSLMKADLENDDVDLNLDIFSNNKTIPLILTENGKIVNYTNIDQSITQDSKKLKELLEQFKKQNAPLIIKYDEKNNKEQYLYYGNSILIGQLKYYPIALLLIIFLFAALVYNYFTSNRVGAQNKLWAGMAKETAHQIGTPLSSLLGWMEILRAENVEETYLNEIQIDIDRLQTIADRFSKVGSVPVLESKDIVEETRKSFEYLKSRFSQQVQFSFTAPNSEIKIPINEVLHSWTIENLMKNSIDAMRGQGKIDVSIESDTKTVKINVADTGKGISKNQFKTIFEPGFTTKKRGWGLGLSLTKRIVEEYHKGKIRVLHSEIGKGTTFQISFTK
jgi:two-component system, sporulation sensor kinase D